jgi:HK97 gp10 family phage protein
MAEMEVFGLSTVLANISTYGKALQDDIQVILEAGGDIGLQMMDELVAVDTGYMRSRNQKKVEQGSVTLSNDTDYFIFNELGTSKMAAHPAMVPAMIVMEDFIMGEFKRL